MISAFMRMIQLFCISGIVLFVSLQSVLAQTHNLSQIQNSSQIQNRAPSPLAAYPIPSWVKLQTLSAISDSDIPKTEITNGTYYVLFDKQIHVEPSGNKSVYYQFAEQIVDNHGLKNAAQINVTYDPSYEKIHWHSISIIRGNERINKIKTAQFSLLQREQELENSIYNGQLTANVILSDLRVGDLIEYSYSISGQNPVYNGHYSGSFYSEQDIPIENIHFSLIWNKKSPQNKKAPLFHKALETNQPLKITQTAHGSIYELQLNRPKPKKINTQTPTWYNPYGRYLFSDFNQWSEVINWATPIYAAATVLSPDIKKISDEIKLQESNIEHQAALALSYVQKNIRYLGIELHRNSHQPSLAEDTLSRRYGDCKDKTVLLVTLLRALGIQASPVLVHTERQQELTHFLPAVNAFNHVIVKATINNKDYWLDPTREHQKGSITDIYQPHYGYGLVIDKTTKDLTEISPVKNVKTISEAVVDLTNYMNAPVSYKLTTQYKGLDAERQRSWFSNENIADATNKYINFYKHYYPKIKPIENIKVFDDHKDGTLKITESYQINDFWNDEQKPRYTADFYAVFILDAMPKPEEITRNSPYYVAYQDIEEKILIKTKLKRVGLGNPTFQEKNKYFEFTQNATFNKTNGLLTITYTYKTLLNVVPANEIDDYLLARKKARDEAIYSVQEGTAAGFKSLLRTIFGK